MSRLRAAVVVAAMMVLSGCGHQVTGLNSPTGGIVSPGETLLRFEVAAQPDFTNVQYLIVINANGNGHVPIASGSNSNYLDWSFAFFVGGGPGFANTPDLEQYYTDPSQAGGVNHITRVPPTGTLIFTPFTGGVNGFDIRFNRCILDIPSPINTTGAPTPPPSPHPVGTTCPPFFYLASPTWTINIFTIDNTKTAVDSLGNGPADTSYPGFTINTAATILDQAYRKPAGVTTPQSPAEQITGIEAWSAP